MNRSIVVNGLIYEDCFRRMHQTKLTVRVTDDKKLSISNGAVGFTVPYEPIERAIREVAGER